MSDLIIIDDPCGKRSVSAAERAKVHRWFTANFETLASRHKGVKVYFMKGRSRHE